MTLFRSDNRSIKYISMAGDLKSYTYRAGVKRTSDDDYRGFDYHAPVSVTTVPNGFSAPKRPRSSSSSSSSTYSTVRCSRQVAKPSSRPGPYASSASYLRMEELQCIKSELKLIKNQIDELLNRLEHMGSRSRDTPVARLSHSPLYGSVNSVERSSCSPLREWLDPEAGEVSSEERQRNHHRLYYV